MTKEKALHSIDYNSRQSTEKQEQEEDYSICYYRTYKIEQGKNNYSNWKLQQKDKGTMGNFILT